jgi:hypothetical protein
MSALTITSILITSLLLYFILLHLLRHEEPSPPPASHPMNASRPRRRANPKLPMVGGGWGAIRPQPPRIRRVRRPAVNINKNETEDEKREQEQDREEEREWRKEWERKCEQEEEQHRKREQDAQRPVDAELEAQETLDFVTRILELKFGVDVLAGLSNEGFGEGE